MTNITSSRSVAVWLFISCFFIISMVMLGGVTRLTESGLSITQWKPLTGIVPPTTDAAWQDLFTDYQRSPEYQHINRGMDIEGFKGIFWLEFLHRLLGRLTGFVFLIPLIYFATRKRLEKPLVAKLSGVFILGGLQGVVGWYMVRSGLQDSPYVSQYWLAFHLGMACLILAVIFLTALQQWQSRRSVVPHRYRYFAYGLVLAVFCQILLGAFVAGLDAGLIYNTFPLMDGQFIPDGLMVATPFWRNFFENSTLVQLDHRLLAYSVAALIIIFWAVTRRIVLTKKLQFAIHLLLAWVCVQITLGVLTLLHHVPVALGSLHQGGAIILLLTTLFIAYHMQKEVQK